jgi:hypothetical protein
MQGEVRKDTKMDKLYYEAYTGKNGRYGWKVYHYDETGNKEIIDHKKDALHRSVEDAENECCEYMEEKGIEAEYGCSPE